MNYKLLLCLASFTFLLHHLQTVLWKTIEVATSCIEDASMLRMHIVETSNTRRHDATFCGLLSGQEIGQRYHLKCCCVSCRILFPFHIDSYLDQVISVNLSTSENKSTKSFAKFRLCKKTKCCVFIANCYLFYSVSLYLVNANICKWLCVGMWIKCVGKQMLLACSFTTLIPLSVC